jgi:hypothetical protein
MHLKRPHSCSGTKQHRNPTQLLVPMLSAPCTGLEQHTRMTRSQTHTIYNHHLFLKHLQILWNTVKTIHRIHTMIRGTELQPTRQQTTVVARQGACQSALCTNGVGASKRPTHWRRLAPATTQEWMQATPRDVSDRPTRLMS